MIVLANVAANLIAAPLSVDPLTSVFGILCLLLLLDRVRSRRGVKVANVEGQEAPTLLGRTVEWALIVALVMLLGPAGLGLLVAGAAVSSAFGLAVAFVGCAVFLYVAWSIYEAVTGRSEAS